MADKFTFTAAQRANLRTELATTLLYTELGGNKADGYKFSFAGTGKSGYSFGVAQIDVRNNASANTFLKSIGLSDSEISTLRSGTVGNELSTSFVNGLSAKLAANTSKVDAFMADQLDAKVTRLENIINTVQDKRPDVAQSIKDSDALKMAILDYDNQLVVTGAGTGEKASSTGLLSFLSGNAVLNPKGVAAKDGDGASQLAPNAGLATEDILNFKKNQTEWGVSKDGKKDIERRENDFQNAINKLKVSEGVTDDVDSYAALYDPDAQVYVSGKDVTVDGRTYRVVNNDTLEADLPGGLKEIRSANGTGRVVDAQGKEVLALSSEDRVAVWDDGRVSVEKSVYGEGQYRGRTSSDIDFLSKTAHLSMQEEVTGTTDGQTYSHTEYDAVGNVVEVQTANYDSKKGLTEVDVYRDGTLIGHTTIQGQATQAQLDKALNIAEQVANATSFGNAGKSDSGEAFLDTLNAADDNVAQLAAGQQALGVADSKYSGSNVASTPVFSTLTDYATWLKGRGTSTNVNNDVVADPSLLGLQDGALTVALARQNPNPVNVMRALQSVVLAGGVLSESFKQSVADQLGTNTANVNTWVASGGAAITSFLVAMDNPSVTNVTSAAFSMINAGITFTPSLQQTFADKLGVTSGQFGQMLAYGGAGLAVASALKNPTPQNIVGATQQVTAILGKMQGSASLQNLSYTLGTATAVFSVYNFAKNPNKQTAVSAMLNIGMQVAPEFAVPLAAALAIGEMIIPGFTDKAVDALTKGVKGFYYDVPKQIIKVEVALVKDTINLAGSVVEVVGGTVNSAGNLVADVVGGAVNTATNVVKKVWKAFTPLVVNLADDPVHTTTLSNKSPLFDMSGDGVKERTGWITADEGFLVRDLNGNGKIDSINEMFSERTSTTASTAFGALAELDSNKDGVISSTDANWSTLKIWVDKNSDGETQANELYTLAQLGISSIKLNLSKNFTYDNGNIIGDKSTFVYTDGRVGEIADAFFTTQTASSTQNVAQTLMTQDSTTVRLSNGQTMKVLDVHGKTLTVGSAIEGINIVTSTGGNSLTAADDANGLVLMGETGDTLSAGNGHAVVLVSNGGAKLVGNAEDNLYVVNQTTDVIVEAANAGVDTVRASATYTLSANLENLTLTGTTVINGTGNALNNVLTGNNADNVLNGDAGNDTLDGGAGADILIGGLGSDTYVVDNVGDVVIEEALDTWYIRDTVNASVSYTLTANVENLNLTGTAAINGTGNELSNNIYGNSAANVLSGGAGDDQLYGGLGNDTLDGGVGNDYLSGDLGNDTYLFGRGSGQDRISEYDTTIGNVDTVQLGSGIATDQLWFRHVGNDLEVSIIGGTDKATIQNWYGGSQNQIEQIKVANKTLLNTDVEKLVQAMASFSAPASGQTTLPTNYQTTLAPVIAANWH